MADTSSTSNDSIRRFDKELSEDYNDYHLDDRTWTQARNAINNSKTGDLGKLGNEPANQYCTSAGQDDSYVIIGAIHTEADIWVLFSTNEVDSEIGMFQETGCIYKTIVNNKCLNFSKFHLIKGVSRPTADCYWKIYWDDGNNPSRVLTVKTNDFDANLYTNPNSPIPWIQTCRDENGNPPGSAFYPQGCIFCENTADIDCEKIRLAPLIQIPCVTVSKGTTNGALLNGSYFAVIAYTLNSQKITDYFKPSNVQPLFIHKNEASSLNITIENTDLQFDGYQLVVVSNISNQTVAKKIGTYNITQKQITLDIIEKTLETVPIEQIPLRTPVYEKTDAMFTVSDYLIRTAPTTKLDFNYQPLANQIVTKWQSVEYSADYYKNGGSNTGYLRDEVYSFFIRWIYNTGDRSSSYHIPGRPALTVGGYNENAFSLDPAPFANDALASEISGGFNYNWWVNNLAQWTASPGTVLADGGVVIGEGIMGYWESTEYYPNNNPEVWNANDINHPWTSVNILPYNGTDPGSIIGNTVTLGDYDLCGKPIRHHKMPDVHVIGDLNSSEYLFSSGGSKIRILGVAFDNIKPPVDNEGNLIPGIVGYEILRGSRQGNRTILAKGIINNMWKYDLNLDFDDNPNTGTIQGLYQNYPYNDLRPDHFLSTKHTWSTKHHNYTPPVDYSQNDFTFHSPTTTFDSPFLSGTELKLSSEFNGTVTGNFELSELHPKAKVLTDLAFIVSAMAGIGIAAIGMNGQRTVRRQKAELYTALWGMVAGNDSSTVTVPAAIATLTGTIDPAAAAVLAALNSTSFNFGNWLAGLNSNNTAFNDPLFPWDSLNAAASSLSNIIGGTKNYDYTESAFSTIPGPLKILNGVYSFFHYWTQGTDDTLEIIRALSKYRDFALKYNSHGFYNSFNSVPVGNRRRTITDQTYIGPEFVDYTPTKRINNLFRNKAVALTTDINVANPNFTDNTRQLASEVPNINPNYDADHPQKAGSFNTNTSCYYSSIKQRLRNQYEQIDSISQVLIDKCYVPVKASKPGKPVSNSGTLFGGDIYLNRYTEKTTFFYFYDWLYTQPDGYQFNYDNYVMVPYPAFWLNMEKFDTTDFTESVLSNITNPFLWTNGGPGIITPGDYYNLDNDNNSFFQLRLTVKNAYFYLFNSGVRDFFVESEINVDLRDYGDLTEEKYYPLIDTKTLFDTRIIKSPNYYKYDNALTIANVITNRISWGTVQPRTYSPYLSEFCYQYTPTRAIYSLQSQYESKTDYWRVFLVNNYYDFDYYITSIKPVNKNGALIFFDSGSPVQFQGADQLETDLGTKLTIGDGGLFSQPMQNVVNADKSYEYGSCQDSMSIINTPMGIYWISQNQGKILKIGEGIEEISLDNMKWWFAQYLPYQLTTFFPNFELTDNPVAGIGCQSIFDNENQLLYFCKRDYTLKTDIPDGIVITYLGTDQFAVNVQGKKGELQQINTITLGDPLYFSDASWTISYDPKTQGYIGYHDWHPTYSLPGKNTFMTVNPDNKREIWMHNQRCDLYANYYGIDYPFEVEWAVNTGNQTFTLRSVEYQLEVYKYAPNCYDRFHKLDTNFDEAVVYNTEQCSGLLKLNLTPRNNAPAILNYPVINPSNIEILYSKVEQKYRFNQFWDITRDRGEFPIGSPYPPPTPNVGSYAMQTIWNTAPNGYIRTLNPNNLNYNKFALERKKFRHYTNTVLLRKLVSGDSKFLVMTSTNKNLYSPR